MNTIQTNGINFGIILGLISATITAVIYLIDLSYFASWWIGLLVIAANILVFVIGLLTTKKQLGGVFPFKAAFTTYFIIAIIGLSISSLFNYLLFNHIDLQAKAQLAKITIETTAKMMADFGAPQSAIDVAIADMESTDNYSLTNIFKGWLISTLFYALFGLLFALVFRKNEPTNMPIKQ